MSSRVERNGRQVVTQANGASGQWRARHPHLPYSAECKSFTPPNEKITAVMRHASSRESRGCGRAGFARSADQEPARS